MEIQFDLNEAITNPAKAPAIIKQVQDAFTELTEANIEALEAAKDAQKLNEEYHLQVENLTKGTIGLTDTIKAIHSVLGSKADLFSDDPEMKVLLDHVGTFILSSGSIKLGVLSENNNAV